MVLTLDPVVLAFAHSDVKRLGAITIGVASLRAERRLANQIAMRISMFADVAVGRALRVIAY